MSLSEPEIRQRLAEIAGRSPKALAERAIEALYLEFSPAVRNYLWKNWLQDTAEIDEVLQDCFWEVWKNPERFRGDSLFKTWLLGIARFKAMDRLRKQHREAEVSTELDEVMEETLPSSAPAPADLVQHEQIRAAIGTCMESLSTIGKLSAVQCEVLHLAYVEDLDIADIASLVGCPENTVKTRLHHARLRIKDCLARRLSGVI